MTGWLIGVHFCAAQDGFDCGMSERMKLLPAPTSQQYITSNVHKGTGAGPYIIPVVFHVLHLGGPENISDAQIQNAMRLLNNDFNKRNADTATVVPDFENNIANIGVEFRLAKLDPNGLPTNGIDRIYTTLTNHGWDDSSKINQWPQDKYLNIWVCKDLEGHAAAYSFYPSYAQLLPLQDGIMIQYNYLGSTGSARPTTAHVLTHEVGHFFNLKHPWDDLINGGPCGDDDVFDTPITQSSGCNLSLATCNPPIVENVQNFMTGSYCNVMFTNGQKDRMDAALNNLMGNRIYLWQIDNLIATGTSDPTAVMTLPGQQGGWMIYPNPVQEQLFLKTDRPGAAGQQVCLYNTLGQCVSHSFISGGAALSAINVSGLADGLYQLVITADGRPVERVKIIKGNAVK